MYYEKYFNYSQARKISNIISTRFILLLVGKPVSADLFAVILVEL